MNAELVIPMVHPYQLDTIFELKEKLKLREEAYKIILNNFGGVEFEKDLNYRNANHFIHALRYAFSPMAHEKVSIYQIKKIHTLKSVLNIPDEHYRSLLMRWGVKSSKELSRHAAIGIIDFLVERQKERFRKQPQLFGGDATITRKQFDMMTLLWAEVSDAKDYDSLRVFVRKVTRVWFLWLEGMSRNEAGLMISILKEWKAKRTGAKR